MEEGYVTGLPAIDHRRGRIEEQNIRAFVTWL